jgi:hypothetical protein
MTTTKNRMGAEALSQTSLSPGRTDGERERERDRDSVIAIVMKTMCTM